MAQRSNREAILEATLGALADLPLDRVTARVISERSGANLASIGYHFGSKDRLIAEAAVLGLDRWLADLGSALADLHLVDAQGRIGAAVHAVVSGWQENRPASRAFIAAVGVAPHDSHVRETLATGIRTARTEVARVLGVPAEAAALLLAMFHGLLVADTTGDGAALTENELRSGLAALGSAVRVENVSG